MDTSKSNSHPQKNTLLKNAQANAASNFFKRVFFSPPREEFYFFSPTLRCFNFLLPTHGANFDGHRFECRVLRTNSVGTSNSVASDEQQGSA